MDRDRVMMGSAKGLTMLPMSQTFIAGLLKFLDWTSGAGDTNDDRSLLWSLNSSVWSLLVGHAVIRKNQRGASND